MTSSIIYTLSVPPKLRWNVLSMGLRLENLTCPMTVGLMITTGRQTFSSARLELNSVQSKIHAGTQRSVVEQ